MTGIDIDADLARRAAQGSDLAFNRLVERHQQAVRAFLRRVLASGWAEADDVAQEAFLAAWMSLRNLNQPEGFRAWMMGIAWRKALDRARGARRGATRDRTWLDDRDVPRGVAPEDQLALRAAMSELSPDVRACVALCLAEGWSNAEASQALALPLGTVKSHVARGRARLLAVLGGEDDA